MTAQEIEQERVRLQNRIDEQGMAVWIACEVWQKLWVGLAKEIEAHHKIDPDHSFTTNELHRATNALDVMRKGERWSTELERIQSQ